MPNLLDLMKKEDRECAERAYKARMAGDNRYKREKVSPIMFLIAELGIYYGWEAIEAVKRGYIETFDEHTGKRQKMLITLEEISALVDAGRKIKYSEYLNQARGTQVAASSALSQHPKRVFEKGMAPFIKEIKS